jgi:hypothetical protein
LIRRQQEAVELPTRAASSALLSEASACSSQMILLSIASNMTFCFRNRSILIAIDQ